MLQLEYCYCWYYIYADWTIATKKNYLFNQTATKVTTIHVWKTNWPLGKMRKILLMLQNPQKCKIIEMINEKKAKKIFRLNLELKKFIIFIKSVAEVKWYLIINFHMS